MTRYKLRQMLTVNVNGSDEGATLRHSMDRGVEAASRIEHRKLWRLFSGKSYCTLVSTSVQNSGPESPQVKVVSA